MINLFFLYNIFFFLVNTYNNELTSETIVATFILISFIGYFCYIIYKTMSEYNLFLWIVMIPLKLFISIVASIDYLIIAIYIHIGIFTYRFLAFAGDRIEIFLSTILIGAVMYIYFLINSYIIESYRISGRIFTFIISLIFTIELYYEIAVPMLYKIESFRNFFHISLENFSAINLAEQFHVDFVLNIVYIIILSLLVSAFKYDLIDENFFDLTDYVKLFEERLAKEKILLEQLDNCKSLIAKAKNENSIPILEEAENSLLELEDDELIIEEKLSLLEKIKELRKEIRENVRDIKSDAKDFAIYKTLNRLTDVLEKKERDEKEKKRIEVKEELVIDMKG